MKKLKTRISYVLWVVAAASVVAIGLIFLPQERDRPGFWESLYSTFRLFVFERDLPTFPSSWPVILIYFAAPLLTLSVLGKLISYLFRLTPSLWSRWKRDHVVVCGAGRLGKIMALGIRRRRVPVVVVDNDYDEELEAWAHKHRIPVVIGDFNLASVLRKAGAGRARAIVFTTSSDLANIDAAFAAYKAFKFFKGEIRLIWTHISDNALANMLRDTVQTEGRLGIRFFDTYYIAAERIARQFCAEGTEKKTDEIILVGYGKLGTDLLEHLSRTLKGRKSRGIRIIDQRDLKVEAGRHAARLGIARRVTFQQQDIRNVQLEKEKSRLFFLCTDSDLGNLALALSLSDAYPGDEIVVRMGHWPMESVSEHLGKGKKLHFVNINDLITRSLDSIPGILTPAAEGDLKRVKKA